MNQVHPHMRAKLFPRQNGVGGAVADEGMKHVDSGPRECTESWDSKLGILGSLESNVPFRHPSLVQNRIYTLDQSNDSLYRLPKFYTPPLHSYPPPMTIISAETKTSPRRSLSASGYVVRDGIFKLTGKPGEVRTPILKAPKLMHRKPVPTALVEEFIQSFKELDSYK